MNLRKTEFFLALSTSTFLSGELLPEGGGGGAGLSGGVKAIIAKAEIAKVVAIRSDMFFK